MRQATPEEIAAFNAEMAQLVPALMAQMKRTDASLQALKDSVYPSCEYQSKANMNAAAENDD